jgi:hypothetical protein
MLKAGDRHETKIAYARSYLRYNPTTMVNADLKTDTYFSREQMKLMEKNVKRQKMWEGKGSFKDG